MTTVYVSIGNSDDKLTQAEWAAFFSQTATMLRHMADRVHGQWASEPASAWQNACWCVEIAEPWVDQVKSALAEFAEKFGQDSIAWAPAVTEFIRPTAGGRRPEAGS